MVNGCTYLVILSKALYKFMLLILAIAQGAGRNLGFGDLPKDTSSCGQEEVGIDLPTL